MNAALLPGTRARAPRTALCAALLLLPFSLLLAEGAPAPAPAAAPPEAAPAGTPAPAEGLPSPFTNTIRRSTFRDLADVRDPFSPVGYIKPPTPKPGETIAPPKPVVDFKLVITGISSIGEGSIATLDSGMVIEPGETYPIRDAEGKTLAEYKVVSITEEKVVAIFEGKEYEFKVRGSDLERFIEKEDPNEKKKP